MKKAVAFSIILIFLATLSYGESKRERIRSLEERVTAIEEVLNDMVQLTTGKNIPLYVDDSAPAAGEIKVVQGTPLVLDACDATTQWSVHSGAGVTISISSGIVYEGAGSVNVLIPNGITAVIKLTKASGSWDLSTYKSLKVHLNSYYTAFSNVNLHFGEAAYNEQNLGTFSMAASGAWIEKTWDISGIATASRNGVTLFAVTIPNTSGFERSFLIDYVFADPGYGKVQAGLSERTATLMPPYVGTYTATATDPRTISVPRAGQIKSLLIVGDDGSPAYFATSDMAGKAKKLSGTVALDSNQITSLGDGTFTVTGTMNNNGTVYYYQAVFED